jgi:hypothetical protein
LGDLVGEGGRRTFSSPAISGLLSKSFRAAILTQNLKISLGRSQRELKTLAKEEKSQEIEKIKRGERTVASHLAVTSRR